MDFNQIIHAFGLYLASMVVGFSSALIPVINVEAYLLLIGYLVHDSRLSVLLILVTFFHLLGKTVLYLVGRGSLRLNLFNLEERVERARKKYKIVRIGSLWTILISALTGIPPFYVITILAGTMKIKLWQFFSLGLFGRLIRFSILLYLPQLVAGLF